MKIFAASLPQQQLEQALTRLEAAWSGRHVNPRIGKYLSLFWGALTSKEHQSRLISILGTNQTRLLLDGINVSDITLSGDWLRAVTAKDSELTSVILDDIDLSDSDFRRTVFDTCSLKGARLDRSDFQGALFFECDLTSASFEKADFRELDPSSTFQVQLHSGATLVLSGNAAIGYLSFYGGLTDEIDDYNRYRFHRGFPIMMKIVDRLLNAKYGQYLGLTQKGESRADPKFARRFVDFTASTGLTIIDKNKNVSLTADGRDVMAGLSERQVLSEELVAFLKRED